MIQSKNIKAITIDLARSKFIFVSAIEEVANERPICQCVRYRVSFKISAPRGFVRHWLNVSSVIEANGASFQSPAGTPSSRHSLSSQSIAGRSGRASGGGGAAGKDGA
jgi:hypothetical protein